VDTCEQCGKVLTGNETRFFICNQCGWGEDLSFCFECGREIDQDTELFEEGICEYCAELLDEVDLEAA
jgi:hypothetical protein